MNAYFDVFFHQQAIPLNEVSNVLYQKDSVDEIVRTCSLLYEYKAGKLLGLSEKKDLNQKIQSSVAKRYIEIQFFDEQELYWEVLLEELVAIFPQFLWTRIVEERDKGYIAYSCEFIPITFTDKTKIYFSVSDSLYQMGYTRKDSISAIIEKKIYAIFQRELPVVYKPFEVGDSLEDSLFSGTDLSIVEEQPASDVFEEIPTRSSKRRTNDYTKTKTHDLLSKAQLDDLSDEAIDTTKILYLKESLKRERSAKERLKVAKEKLEHELVTIENRLLMSGLIRFKKYQKSPLSEDNWYQFVRIDLIQYDDLYKKAKFIERSWKLNCQLVTVTEKLTFTKNKWVYERAKVEKVKNTVAELELKSMMEQCHLINDRIKIRPGFLFIKPSVKLYRVDFEQLQKISAFFDIIQTENKLLESVIESEEVN